MLDQLKQQDWKSLLLRSDVMVAVGLVAILMVMILPLPSFMLDIFLSMNITIALLILIICLYTMKPLEFALFPSVLLATTLFRLSLNVASTRLILLRGNEGPSAAGSVIQSFGQFVVGGNYVVGIVVFIILVVINFMVITKGAGRVAEVSARFTLDAMPGKQMAIDADLNAGLLTEAEARERRQEIASEATFYGAMDGASKFVKGDAIAGIIITLINIGAGFVIGVMQKSMAPGTAAETYTILTVGDGLVGQIPALIISTAAGILVTRTAGEQDFGGALKTQFSIHPQALWVVSGILLAFALIPGLPTIPFLVLSSALAFAAYKVQKTQADEEIAQQQEHKPSTTQEENYEEMLAVDMLELEVGYGLIPMVDANQNGELLPRIRSIRKQFALDFGFIIPPIHIKDNLQLKPNAGGEILPNHHLAMNPGIATEPLKGVATTEPAFGLPATWIAEELKERAQIAGYTVVDGTTVITTHITEIIKRHAHELIGRQEVQNLLDNIGKSYPKLVEELTPNLLPLGCIMKVLQNLLREQVSIRDLRTILETLADWGGATKDPDLLTEQVRQAMARAISGQHAQEDDLLELMTLDQQLEETIEQSVQRTAEGSYLTLDPGTAQGLLENLAATMQSLGGGTTPILLCPPTIRPHVKRLTERYLPNLVCLSHNEISPHLRVQSVGTVSINAG
jgi:flagellar biosynthesis protein FlhA